MTWPDWVEKMDHLAAAGTPFLFILDFDLRSPIILPLDEVADQDTISFEIGSNKKSKDPTEHFEINKAVISFDKYQLGFNTALEAIHAGDSYLLNLCYATGLRNLSSLKKVYQSVRAPYKLLVDGQFVVFSPEQFVSVADGVIRTFPMKGTIDASVPDAAQRLLSDVKEQEEHATVVDLLRNDLSIVADHVRVDRYRYLTEIKTSDKSLLQCSSEISGKLTSEYIKHPGRMMHALLPAGSVTGAPKKRTVELIHEIEPEPRNYFTGVFGVYDSGHLDSAVMIRMIEQRADGFWYRSGGGLTYRSQPEMEYREMIDKVYIPI